DLVASLSCAHVALRGAWVKAPAFGTRARKPGAAAPTCCRARRVPAAGAGRCPEHFTGWADAGARFAGREGMGSWPTSPCWGRGEAPLRTLDVRQIRRGCLGKRKAPGMESYYAILYGRRANSHPALENSRWMAPVPAGCPPGAPELPAR